MNMEEIRELKDGDCFKEYSDDFKIVDCFGKANRNKVTVDNNNFIHNINDKPALIQFHSKNIKEFENWYNHGYQHRLTGPAYISYYKVDSKGFLHNINDKPALIYCNKDGNKYAEFWYEHGVEHRLTGPSWISYTGTGNVSNKQYYINGKKLTQEEFETYINRINMLNDL